MITRPGDLIQKNTLATSFLVAGMLFLVFQVAATPLLNSGDDAFLMYTLSGAYGEAPTHLLHYNHIWHPVLGWTIKSLYSFLPGINWYTIALVLFHYAGCVLILHVLVSRAGVLTGHFLFLVFFFFFETRLLLSLSFTSSALVAAAGSCLWLQWRFGRWNGNWMSLLPGLLLLLLAGMLRLHIAWLVMLLFVPLAVTSLRGKSLFRWMIACTGVAILLGLLNLQHQAFYRKQIPGWEQQESRRQSLFYAYNRPVKENAIAAFTDSAEMQLYFAGFIYDTTHFTPGRLSAIGRQVTRQRWLDEKEDREGLYWFFMEMRIYFLLFAIMIVSLVLMRAGNLLRKWAWSLATVVLVYGGLFVYLKLTPAVHVGLIAILWLQFAALWTFRHEWMMKPRYRVALGVLMLLAFSWMGIRVVEENRNNRSRRETFRCAWREISQDREKILIATDDSFPLSYFYCWDSPSSYSVTNLVYKDRMLTYTYRKTLERFGIASLDSALLRDERVYLLGKPVPALEKKYNARYSGRFPAYKCLEVRKLLGSW